MKRVLILIVLTWFIFSLASVPHVIAGKKYLKFGTASIGGIYYIFGGGWAKVMNAHLENIEVTAQVSGGSTQNTPRVNKGELDIGMAISIVVDKYYREKGMTNLRCLYPGFAGYKYLYGLANKGLSDVESLNGKVAGWVRPVDKFAREAFEAWGVKIAKIHHLSHQATIEALKDGTIDFSMVWGPERWPGLVQLEATHGVQFITMTDAQIEVLLKTVPAYSQATVPAGTYKGMKTDYKTVALWHHFLVNKSMPEEIAYKLAKATYESQEELLKIHPVAKEIRIENALKAVIPFHPGTIRYLKERGIKVPPKFIAD